MLAVVRGQVGAAASERDAQRAACDDHLAFSRYTRWTTRKAACASAMPGCGWRFRRISSRNSANSVSQELSDIFQELGEFGFPGIVGLGDFPAVVSGGPMAGFIA